MSNIEKGLICQFIYYSTSKLTECKHCIRLLFIIFEPKNIDSVWFYLILYDIMVESATFHSKSAIRYNHQWVKLDF